MKTDSTLKMAVIERDPTYAQASTTLSMANAHIQFSLKHNIEISQHALEVLAQFEDEMADFVPDFDRLKLVRGWAGPYAVNTLDGNAVLGEWPEIKGLFLANGFSGHGLQQAPAVGRYLAELILQKPLSLDLSIFSPQRILENKPLSEGGLV